MMALPTNVYSGAGCSIPRMNSAESHQISLCLCQKNSATNTKRFANFEDQPQGGLILSAFDGAEVRSLDVGHVRKGFLR
jgi:hypothetical protein